MPMHDAYRHDYGRVCAYCDLSAGAPILSERGQMCAYDNVTLHVNACFGSCPFCSARLCPHTHTVRPWLKIARMDAHESLCIGVYASAHIRAFVRYFVWVHV